MSFLDNMARKIAEKQVEMEDRRAQVRAEREAQRMQPPEAKPVAASPVDSPEPSVSTGKGFCGHCGAPIREGALFCYKCGAKVPEQDSDAEVPAPEEVPEHLELVENPEEEVKENPDTPQVSEDISEEE